MQVVSLSIAHLIWLHLPTAAFPICMLVPGTSVWGQCLCQKEVPLSMQGPPLLTPFTMPSVMLQPVAMHILLWYTGCWSVMSQGGHSTLWHDKQDVLCTDGEWGPGTGELRTVCLSLVKPGRRQRNENTGADTKEWFRGGSLSVHPQGQLFSHKPGICHSNCLPHSPTHPVKIKGVLLGQGEEMSHQHTTAHKRVLMESVTNYMGKAMVISPIKALRMILMLRK